MRKQTQEDHVREDQGFLPELVKDKIYPPGIETLHEKASDEIAEVLTLAIRSRNNVQEIRYVLGEYIEVTSRLR